LVWIFSEERMLQRAALIPNLYEGASFWFSLQSRKN